MIDIQSKGDNRGLSLNWVGISHYKHPICFEGFNSIADVNFFVSLASEQKAIHMSRAVELLQGFTDCDLNSIDSLLSSAQKLLEADNSRIELSFLYIRNKSSPVTNKAAGFPYQLKLEGEKHGPNISKIKYSLCIPVASVCPCSKAISDYGAHNQRGFITIGFISTEKINITELISTIEKCGSAEIFSLLKRQDEKNVTETGYINAKFVEDIARDVVLALPDNLMKNGVGVTVENMESIHAHNAIAVYRTGVFNAYLEMMQ